VFLCAIFCCTDIFFDSCETVAACVPSSASPGPESEIRTNWQHAEANLKDCIHSWLTRDDEDFLDLVNNSFFKTSEAYVTYYLSGGKEKVQERKMKEMATNHFDNLENAQATRREHMRAFYEASGAPANAHDKDATSTEKLRSCLHELFAKISGRVGILF
jgi:hypothetical protein